MKNKYIFGLEYPVSKAIYEESNRFTEKSTEIINLISIKIFYPMAMMTMLVVNDYIYFTTNVFRLPFPYWYAMHAFELNAILTENCCVFVMHLNSRFPFDWGNPHGYLMAFILIYITQLNWIFFVRCSLCFGIGVYMFIIALTKDITADLEFLRDITISHHCQSQHLSYSLLSFYCSFRVNFAAN